MYETYKHSSCEESDTVLNNILDIASEGFWDWHASTGYVERSPGWYRMLGFEVGIFKKNVITWENIIHPDDYPMVMKHFELYIAGKIDKYQIEYRCKRSDGSYLWIIDKGRIVEYDDQHNVARMIGAHENIHERKMAEIKLVKQNDLLQKGNLTLENLLDEKNKELENKNIELNKKILEVQSLSFTDPLTTIGNRRYFQKQIVSEVSRCKRYKYSLSLILIDIDLFKRVNDSHGHEKGDFVLNKLAVTLKNKLREHDCFARWGGEEFILILPETNLEQGVLIAEKLRRAIQYIDFEDDLFITCSLGVAEYSHDESIDTFFSRTDKALYKAKDLGRNRVEI